MLTVLIGLGLGLLCSRGLLSAYSYWHHELFSIWAANSTSWRSQFEDWMHPDTHPPLHLVLLKAWAIRGGGFTRQCSCGVPAAECPIWGPLLTWLPAHDGQPLAAK